MAMEWAVSQVPAETTVSGSMWTGPVRLSSAATRMRWRWAAECTRRIAASTSSRIGAPSRRKAAKPGPASASSTARIRAGRSGLPGPAS